MMKLLQRETPKFIYPDLWPLSSPDLNPVDYRIWGVKPNCVYQTPVREVTYLRQRLIDTWNDLSQSILYDAVNEWHKKNFKPVWMKKEDSLDIYCNILG